MSVLILVCIGVNYTYTNEKKNKEGEKLRLHLYIQAIKTAKRESYPTFCNDLAKFPSLWQYIILLYRLLLTYSLALKTESDGTTLESLHSTT